MTRMGAESRLYKVLAAILLAGLALLGLMVTLTLAQIELPPGNSVAFVQTSGPNTELNIGDWYSSQDQGNRPHSFKIFVPCTVDPGQLFTVELFDPEVFVGVDVVDEIRPPTTDDATFELHAPDGRVIAAQTYTPSAATNDQFVTLATFTTGVFDCGIYTLLARTSDNDDNAWRLRVTPDDPDTTPGTGDELLLASFEASFQHTVFGCQEFFFFVPVTPSIRLNNFDLDVQSFTVSIDYFSPGGGSQTGVASGQAAWNNGDASSRGGDVINDPTPGWWRTQICTQDDNQYIFEPEGLTHFFEQPPVPQMMVSKDDGLTVVAPGDLVTYTISYANTGQGAALNTVLTETLPASTTFVACSGGLSCAEAPSPGSGMVRYALGTIPSGAGGQVNLTLRVGDVTPSDRLTNTAQLDYTDTMNNDYPALEAIDANEVPPFTPTFTPTPTPTPTSSPSPSPTPLPSPTPDDDDDDDDSIPPTFTPTPTSPPSSQVEGTPGVFSDVAPQPTPAFPVVTFLPETGTNGISLKSIAIAGITLLLVVLSTVVAVQFLSKHPES